MFYILYKELIKNDIKNYNVVLKLYDEKNNSLYICLDKNILIKINKYSIYEEILDNLTFNNTFIIKDKTNYYMSIGNFINTDINQNIIKKIFFKNYDLQDKKYKKNYNLMKKYNRLTIMFWISTKIDF